MPKHAHPTARALEAIAERMVRDLPNHSSAKSMQGVINRLAQGAMALDGVHQNRSPLETGAAHALKVAKMARQLDKEVTVSINRLGEAHRVGREAVQRRIEEKVNLKPDAFAAEIRAAFRTLSARDKAALVNQACERKSRPGAGGDRQGSERADRHQRRSAGDLREDDRLETCRSRAGRVGRARRCLGRRFLGNQYDRPSSLSRSSIR